MLVVTYNIISSVSLFDPLPMALNVYQGFQPLILLFKVVPDMTSAYAANPQKIAGGAA